MSSLNAIMAADESSRTDADRRSTTRRLAAPRGAAVRGRAGPVAAGLRGLVRAPDPPARHALGVALRPRDPRPGPGGDLRVRPDGLQPHPHRQRAPVRRVLAAQALP